jgi:branched-chain amino acid transport system substrate-binding protein
VLERSLGAGVCVVVLVGVALASGGDGLAATRQKISGTNLTIYSSLPRQGASAPNIKATERGIQMAVAERNGKVGKYTITYRPLDDSLASTGAADPGRGRKNANAAAGDANAVGYIGEFNSSISKVTIPILNKAGIAQVSPSNTYTGLTSSAPGSEHGEPGKYYPTGKRTYARVLPNDVIQAAALATAAHDDGCASVTLLNSRTTYSAGLVKNLARSAKQIGLPVKASLAYDRRASSYTSLAKKVDSPCVIQTGEIASHGVQVLKAVAAAHKSIRLYGADAICLDPTYGFWKSARKSLAPRFRCAIAALDPASFGEKGRKFFADYSARYGDKHPYPEAIYGYESMALLLDAIQRATQPSGSPPYQDPVSEVSREKVVAALFGTRDRDSVLGSYSIDPGGDTTLTDYGLYRISGQRLVFDRVIRPARPGR